MKDMELLKYITEWIKGEVFQGKVMIAIGVMLLIGGIMILKNGNELLSGTTIPLAFILLIFFGYGGFMAFGRPAHLDKVTVAINTNEADTIKMEAEKAQKDHRMYSILKIIWSILIVVAVGLYFIFTKDYYKGLAIGLIALFFATLVVDTVLHHRLKIYQQGISTINMSMNSK
ncbi:hypothetical protein H8E88_10675 [candidate division KSB1 bacterium]|nr:hypothetical protein [candidate division KSB1 bacterium]